MNILILIDFKICLCVLHFSSLTNWYEKLSVRFNPEYGYKNSARLMIIDAISSAAQKNPSNSLFNDPYSRLRSMVKQIVDGFDREFASEENFVPQKVIDDLQRN